MPLLASLSIDAFPCFSDKKSNRSQNLTIGNLKESSILTKGNIAEAIVAVDFFASEDPANRTKTTLQYKKRYKIVRNVSECGESYPKKNERS